RPTLSRHHLDHLSRFAALLFLRSPSCAGSNLVASRSPRLLIEPVVVGEDSLSIKAHRRLQMQGVEGAEIRHRQEPCGPVGGPVERRERHAIENRAHLRVNTPLPYCPAA